MDSFKVSNCHPQLNVDCRPDAVQLVLGLQSEGRSAIVFGERSQVAIAAISGLVRRCS